MNAQQIHSPKHQTPNIPAKRSYHPSILIAFHLKFLPEELSSALPRSTRSGWNHKEQRLQFGYDWFIDNKDRFATLQCVAANEHLIKINKALIKIIALRRFITSHKQRLKDKAGSAAAVVVNTIEKLKPVFNVKKILHALQMDAKEYRKLRKEKQCSISIFNRCVIKHPNQILKQEVNLIKEYNQNPEYVLWPKISIFHQMRKEGVLYCSRNTYYRVINALGLQNILPANRRKKHTKGIRAGAPMTLLHIDVTRFVCRDGSKSFIYVVKDNFSKAILHAMAADTVCMASTEQCLNMVIRKFKHLIKHPLEIMSDGGPENNSIKEWIKDSISNLKLSHITALADVEFSNSMVEAAHYMLKYYGLYQMIIPDKNTLLTCLPKIIDDYNNRPNHTIAGLTPFEALAGKTHTDIFANIKYPITKEQRIIENKKLKCCGYSF